MPGGFEDNEALRAAIAARDLVHREDMEKIKEMERKYQQQQLYESRYEQVALVTRCVPRGVGW